MDSPKFISFDFHARYFPALLWNHLRMKERPGTGFASTLEHYIAFAICIVLLVFGIPAATSSGSVMGWIACGTGAAGAIALIIHSILSHKGVQVSYDGFLTGVFFFFVILGISSGIFIGTLKHSLVLGLLAGFTGLLSGYLLGIMVGLFLQHLGWVSSIISGLAGIAALGMLAVDLVLLSGVL